MGIVKDILKLFTSFVEFWNVFSFWSECFTMWGMIQLRIPIFRLIVKANGRKSEWLQ